MLPSSHSKRSLKAIIANVEPIGAFFFGHKRGRLTNHGRDFIEDYIHYCYTTKLLQECAPLSESLTRGITTNPFHSGGFSGPSHFPGNWLVSHPPGLQIGSGSQPSVGR
jgi:hypothetical protein